jgi:DNA-binding CsgD family transcriptional regulator
VTIKADPPEKTTAEAIRLLGEPGFEPALSQMLQRIAAPDNLAILIYRHSGPLEVLYTETVLPQVFAELRGVYTSGAYLLDPYYDLHLRHVPAGAYRLRDIAPDAFQRSRYFIDYYHRTTLVDEVAFIAYPAEGVTLNICLGRDPSSGQPFTSRQIEACQQIAPIVIALAERHWSALRSGIGLIEDVVGSLILSAFTVHGIRLSRRQAEVALLILKGHSSVSAGMRLGVSVQTIKVFRKQLYRRCQISSQAELFALMLPMLKAAT